MTGNATIYIADPSLMNSRLFDRIESIQSYDGLSEGTLAVGVRFTLAAGQVAMNFMPGNQIEQYLERFAGFAQHVIADRDQLIYVQARIYCVRFVCGCVITPDFDDDGTIEAFLFQFTAATNGLLFLADTIFDHDGRPLGGRYAEQSS